MGLERCKNSLKATFICAEQSPRHTTGLLKTNALLRAEAWIDASDLRRFLPVLFNAWLQNSNIRLTHQKAIKLRNVDFASAPQDLL